MARMAAIDPLGLRQARGAEVDAAAGLGRDDVGPGAAPDRRDIGGDAAVEVGQRMDLQDRARDSATTALRPSDQLPPAWARTALIVSAKPPAPLRAGHTGALRAAGRLGDQHGTGPGRRAPRSAPRLVGLPTSSSGRQQQGDRAPGRHAPGAGSPARMEGEEAAGLHVVDAGAMGALGPSTLQGMELASVPWSHTVSRCPATTTGAPSPGVRAISVSP